MRLLVVEDDLATSRMLRRGLSQAGYAVDTVADGEQALRAVGEGVHAGVLLDVMLPGELDGFEVCRRLRARRYWGAVVLLTARGSVQDRIRGLDAGADDYVVKPFSVAELTARLRAQTRRPMAPRPSQLEVGDLRLDPGSHRVWRDGVEVSLSAREFALLETFMRHAGQVLSRSGLLAAVWDEPDGVASNVVDQRVGYLRRKIDDPFGCEDIQTVRGAGYRLRQP